MFKKKPKTLKTLEQLVKEGGITSMLAVGTENDGALKLKAGVKIDGRQLGSVTIAGSNAAMWVSESGEVKGDCSVAVGYIFGMVTGTIIADMVVLGGDAVISGKIFTDQVVFSDPKRVSIQADILPKRAAREQDQLPTPLLTPLTKVELVNSAPIAVAA